MDFLEASFFQIHYFISVDFATGAPFHEFIMSGIA